MIGNPMHFVELNQDAKYEGKINLGLKWCPLGHHSKKEQ